MAKTVQDPLDPDVYNPSLSISSSCSFSTGTWSDESIADGANFFEPVAYNNNNDWTPFPDIANEFAPNESNGILPDS
ncbi:unnamed protein product, partial [Penicillium palitans]